MNKDIRDALCDMGHDEAVVFDGPDFDEAIIGVTDEGRVIYDYDKMVCQLEEQEGVSQIDAEDYIGYNTIRALPYFGPNAPIIMYPIGPFLGPNSSESETPKENPAVEYLEKLLDLYTNDHDITVAKALDILNRQCNKYCPHCGEKLLPSTTQGYTWQCLNCEEDFCDFETKEAP